MINKKVFLSSDGNGKFWKFLPKKWSKQTPDELTEYELVPTGRKFKMDMNVSPGKFKEIKKVDTESFWDYSKDFEEKRRPMEMFDMFPTDSY